MDNIFNKWREGLSKTRDVAFGKLANFFGATEIDDSSFDDLEELLIQADVGPATTIQLVDTCTEIVDREGLTHKDQLYNVVKAEMSRLLEQPSEPDLSRKPTVIMVAGVNGSGKTTSIAKLTQMFQADGRRVVLGAADTFRAAAVEQLTIWAKRLGAEIVTGPSGSDPASVAHRAVARAIELGADVCVVDTAGRLQTQQSLMQELSKIHRVLGKQIPDAPHEVLLVLDATTGQNGISQARHFTDAVRCTGLVLAKLDGTAKGGVVVAIRKQVGLPVKYIGVGESADDIALFEADPFVDAMFENIG